MRSVFGYMRIKNLEYRKHKIIIFKIGDFTFMNRLRILLLRDVFRISERISSLKIEKM